jgi:hypothetical protein
VKVYVDFNSGTADEKYVVILLNGQPIERSVAATRELHGKSVVAYQDEEDFEVQGTLQFGEAEGMIGEIWYFVPNWETLKRN